VGFPRRGGVAIFRPTSLARRTVAPDNLLSLGRPARTWTWAALEGPLMRKEALRFALAALPVLLWVVAPPRLAAG
jgi:hypothetical protein